MEHDLQENDSRRFFSRLDWSAFWTATLISFAVYVYTLAPTVSLEDSGELAVAGDYLGVPHPPGYPIWTIMAWVFSKLFSFVHFRGQPNPAWAQGLMSAFFGALASGITSMLICRSGADILSRSRQISHDITTRSLRLISWTGGVVGSCLFAFTPIMWSQATIVEVYSLNAFFLVIVLLLIYVWSYRPSNKLLYATAFLFGLGLTNYQVLLLAALALAIIIMFKDFQLFRDFVVSGGAILIMLGILLFGVKHEIFPNPTGPESPVIMTGIILNFAILVITYAFLPRGRTVALTILLAELGVAFYIYMPIVSELRNPPMNWGHPRTWQGFLHAIKRGQYEKIQPSDPLSLSFLSQLGVYLSDLTLNYTLGIALLGFIPFITYGFRIAGKRIRCMEIAVVLLLVSLVLHIGLGWCSDIYKVPALLILLMLAFGASVMIVGNIGRVIDDHLIAKHARPWERILALLVVAAIVAAFAGLVVNNLKLTLAPLSQPNAKVTPAMTRQLLYTGAIVVGTIVMTVLSYWLTKRKFFEITIDRESQKWITATQIAFVTLSIGLIALANLKMDIQDTFIQRVKFISSHALFSFWIGYGVIFVLAIIDGLAPKKRSLSTATAVIMLALIIIPIWKNWHHEHLNLVYGGAEQNGHDFGWQFGNYQLRGADAISEELLPDEEPLPNPSFPPEMEQNAIFFGGTDPGRFVPTYMIYSARVREDVYLITQNALADNTYMSVMRDLYGDQIWIPAQPDSARAFQRYVEEVNAGKRPRNAQLKIENGRVQVSGALGVMEINGILAQMIFEHNNYRHAFYVEESYVIRWMFPYLTPHGLIMKINAEQTPITRENANDDLEFWDWYTRRLTDDSKFMRDIVARKSFSKLRSAIAGLYVSRNMLKEAEQAFQEARALYALSPEANFRLVQEVHMPMRRYDDARDVIGEFSEADPGNSKSKDFLGHLTKLSELNTRIRDLEPQLRTGKLDIQGALELMDLYRQTGLTPQQLQLAASILSNADLPPVYQFQVGALLSRSGRNKEAAGAFDLCVDRLPPNTPAQAYLQMAQIYGRAEKPHGMSKALNLYVARNPGDWRAWLDIASIHLRLNEPEKAIPALQRALQVGGQEAARIVGSDERFTPLRQHLQQNTRRPMSLPGIPSVQPNPRFTPR